MNIRHQHNGMTRVGPRGFRSMRLASASRSRGRGTVLILVVVVIVLMAMMGAAYLQMARVQRVQEARPVDNIDLVLQSVIDEIKRQLKNDVMTDTGQFFEASAGIEPYEYPWTNGDPKFLNNTSIWWRSGDPRGRLTDPVTGTQYNNVIGGHLDDAWLSMGYLNGSSQWPKITSLTQLFVHSTNGVPDTSDGNAVIDALTSSGGGTNSDALWAHNSTGLVDADLDSIGDSRFERAPVALMSGVEYFMAVRIVDLSSRANVNTALALSTGGNALDTSAAGTDAPRWWTPSELNLSTVVLNNSGTAAHAQALLTGRNLPNTLPTPWGGGVNQRAGYWYNGGAYTRLPTGSPYQFFSITDELPLMRHGGRGDGVAEGALESGGAGGWFGTTDQTKTNVSNASSFLTTNPRLLVTTASAAATWTQRVGGDPQPMVKVDVNRAGGAWSGAPTAAQQLATSTALAQAIESVISQGAYPYPAGSPLAGNASKYAAQMAASIRDYADNDSPNVNRVTVYNGRAGLEPLPFVTEVYKVEGFTLTDNGGAGINANTWRVSAAHDPAQSGFAIELRNPFPFQISLSEVQIKIGDDPPVELTTLGLGATLAANTGVILHTSSLDAQSLSTINGAREDATMVPLPISFGNQLRSPTDKNVDLYVKDAATGSYLTQPYSRVVVPGVAISPSGTNPYIDDNYPSATMPNPAVAYKQARAAGTSNYFSILTVGTTAATGLVSSRNYTVGPNPGDSTTADEKPRAFATTQANTVGKRIKGTPRDNQVTDPNLQYHFSQLGEVALVGEIANVAFLGFATDTTETVGDMWGTSNTLDAHRLSFGSDAARIDATVDALNVTHAAFLLDRLTTLAPDRDGIDNDGDGQTDGSDDDERVIPGRINLNTASRELLMALLPIPNGNMRAHVVDAMRTYRDNATPASDRPSGVRANPGLAYIGELGYLNGVWNAYASDVVTGVNTTGNSIRVPHTGGVRVDFLGPQGMTATGPLGGDDAVGDDREERTMVLNALNQVSTTRSDLFVAYIYVVGYRSGDFASGVVESGRMIAVFDRSKMRDENDSPQLVALFNYAN